MKVIPQHIKKGRGHVAQVNASFEGAGAECRRIFALLVRHDIQGLAAKQRNRQLLDGRIKRERRNQPHSAAPF